MRKLAFAAALVSIATVAVADEEIDKFNARTGGWVERPRDGKVVRVVNRQTKVDKTVIEEFAAMAQGALSLAFETVQGEAGKCYASAKDEKVGFWVVIDDDPKCPLILTVAPENTFVKVNVAQLSKDSPDAKKLTARVQKEMWRGLAYALGGGNNNYPGCIMVPAVGVEGIDKLGANMPCPAPFNMMIDTGRKIGITRIGSATYRQACQEGWAPAPTNEFQKVIWNEVNAKPTKPITIKYDKNRGK